MTFYLYSCMMQAGFYKDRIKMANQEIVQAAAVRTADGLRSLRESGPGKNRQGSEG